METRIYKIKSDNIDGQAIEQCAAILKNGGTVAFPTETVYGLGANGLDEQAAKKIFAAKGRPSDNPLILHVHSYEEIEKYALDIPDNARMLINAFSPGPLSIILKKRKSVPDSVTGGLKTAAFRIPSDPIALELIKASALPIAAPSANLSGKPSTTDGSHVIDDLSGRVDAIIDSGRSEIGLESTVVDLTVSPPQMLRPGGTSYRELKMIIPDIQRAYSVKDGNAPKSPGMKYRHYSPEASLTIFRGSSKVVSDHINKMTAGNSDIGILCSDETMDSYKSDQKISVGSIENPEEIASNIFFALRLFDKTGVSAIYSEYFDIGDMEEAVMNRLIKASDTVIEL